MHVLRLNQLVGQWHGEEITFPPSNPTGVHSVTYCDHQLSLGGKFVLAHHVQHPVGGGEPYLNLLIYGVSSAHEDPDQVVYTMHQFDSRGRSSEQPFRGHWQGDQLILESNTQQGRVQFRYQFEGDNTYKLVGEVHTIEGAIKKVVNGSFRRLA